VQVQWEEAVGGTFVAEYASMQLKVYPLDQRQHSRFTILRESATGMKALVGSGTLHNTGLAMQAAEVMAKRIRHCGRHAGLLVVVASSDEKSRFFIADALRVQGYDVVEAGSEEGALRRLERTSRRIFLIADLDFCPDLTGADLARTVRRLWPTARMLLLSSSKPATEQCGVEAYLEKPVSRKALLEKVAALAEPAN
jgi:CheY-like chemotaxis protein